MGAYCEPSPSAHPPQSPADTALSLPPPTPGQMREIDSAALAFQMRLNELWEEYRTVYDQISAAATVRGARWRSWNGLQAAGNTRPSGFSRLACVWPAAHSAQPQSATPPYAPTLHNYRRRRRRPAASAPRQRARWSSCGRGWRRGRWTCLAASSAPTSERARCQSWRRCWRPSWGDAGALALSLAELRLPHLRAMGDGARAAGQAQRNPAASDRHCTSHTMPADCISQNA